MEGGREGERERGREGERGKVEWETKTEKRKKETKMHHKKEGSGKNRSVRVWLRQ